MDDQNQPVTPAPIYQESQEKNAKWLWLLIILIIIGALVFAFFRGIGPFASISPFTKSEASPIATPLSQSESSTVTETSPSPSPVESVDRSEAKLRVLNGSGITGRATATKDFLEKLGWKVSNVGNADLDTYTKTEVRFKPKFKTFEETILKDLSDKYSATSSSDSLEATDSADIEVIVGTK